MNRYTCVNPGACDCGRAEGEDCRHWQPGELRFENEIARLERERDTFKRGEAEIARLEEQHLTDAVLIAGLKARAEKAERERDEAEVKVAWLRDGLREIAGDIPAYRGGEGYGYIEEAVKRRDIARARLEGCDAA